MAGTNFKVKNGLEISSGTVVVSNGAGTNGQVLSSTGTGVQWVNASSGSGDVVGPSSATDNAVVRFDGTTGKLIQNSTVTLSDTGVLTVPELSTTSITSLTNNPIVIAPDGTGDVHLNADSVRIGDNNTDATLLTRGTGDLILTTNEGSATEGIIRIYDGANGNITLTPNGTGQVQVGSDQVVSRTATQTLTGKTISGASNTLSSIGNASLTNSTISGVSLGSNLNTLTISSPLTGTSYNGSAAVSIGIPVATSTANGYLSSTDWSTFNSKGSGTVTSVSGTGTVSGISLSGTVTSSGSLTLGGTLSLVSPPAIGSTTPNTGAFTTLSANTTTTSNAVSVTYNPSATSGSAIFATGGNTQGGSGYLDFLKATNTGTGATNPNKTFRLTSAGALEIVNSAYSAVLLSLTDAGALTANGIIYPNAGIQMSGQTLFFDQSGVRSWNVNAASGNFRIYSGDSAGTFTFNGNTVLNSSNYTSYSPSLSGSGATGSWGISVTGSSASCTGNAATATSATSAGTATNLSGGSVAATTGTFSGTVTIKSGSALGKLTVQTGGSDPVSPAAGDMVWYY